ncbi:MAG: flagellar hook-basal body complex protein [Candidatus Eremiobacteraeota bacterium]|nr:flagellar hook-basal body complex protein [Candidatus Eremiobacteraeota bacterium]
MDGIAWVASAMKAARERLDVATQNVANASTDGYRRAVAQGLMRDDGIEIRTERVNEQGALHRTGRPFDLAIVGDGCFRVRDDRGTITTSRNGAFTRDRFGYLRDDAGRALIGDRGPLRVPENATIQDDGSVRCSDGHIVSRIPLPVGSSVHTGMLESSNVNAIGEMVDVLTAQRSLETAQKVFSAIDGTRDKSSNEVARLK